MHSRSRDTRTARIGYASSRRRWRSNQPLIARFVYFVVVIVAMDLAHKVGRAAADFEINAVDVLADQAEREKNESYEAEQDGEQHPQRAFLLRSVDQAVPGKKRHQQRIEE